MKAEYYVRQVEKLDKLIANKLVEKEQWQAVAMTTTASANDGDRVQSSGNQQKMAEAVHKMIEIDKEIDDLIDKFVDQKLSVIKTLEQLETVEYDILHKIYIQYMDMHQIAENYGKSYSWVVDKRRQGLIHLQARLRRMQKGE